MTPTAQIIGTEIHPKSLGVLFTERIEKNIRVFCFYTSGETTQFQMPTEGNQDNLQHFFTRMNMDPTCSSVILDEVVQARIYVKSEEHCWLYTLLTTPGQTLLPLQGDIHTLPWNCCWRSAEADILELGRPGQPQHRFAIRSELSEADAFRLINQSKAFNTPAFIHPRTPHKWLYLNLGVVLATLTILIGLTIFYTFRNSPMTATTDVAATTPKTETSSPVGQLQLLINHQISGPYPGKTVADLFAAGLVNPGVLCRPVGGNQWNNLTNYFITTTNKAP